MNMEKFGGKKEPFVPDEKLAQFDLAAKMGAEKMQDSEHAKDMAEEMKKEAKKNNRIAVGGVAAAVAGVSVAGPLGVLPGAIIATDFRRWAKNAEKAAQHDLESAKSSKAEGADAYRDSRGIVTEEMISTGAHTDNAVDYQVIATPEQIEIARKEMNEKLEGEK
jgi:hypothetical protein